MRSRWSCVAVLYTLAALQCSYVQGQEEEKYEKRSRALWYRARLEHEGSGLSDQQLQVLAGLSNMAHFWQVLSTILIPRVPDTDGHALVRKHIVDWMSGLGWKVEEDSFVDNTPIGRKRFTNVMATLNPHAPRRLVLACHYDSKLYTDKEFLGATDSAVPCTMLINLALVMQDSLLLHQQTNQDLTLQFIFFDGEEAFRRWSSTDSLYGARNLARVLQAQPYPANNNDNTNELHRIDMLVLLDLLGTADGQFYNFFKETDRWYERMVSYERRLKQLRLLKGKVMFNEQKRYGAGIQDDHLPFLHRGVPVVHLIPIPFPSVWHTENDNRDAINEHTIENLNRVLRAFVADYLHLVL